MELHQLRTFAAVAEEGHLTRAAERLHTSQSAVSAQLKSLEEELGVSLFIRNPRGMALTFEGAVLREEAGRILFAADCLKKKARDLVRDLSGSLKIGLNTDPEFLRMTELHRLMKERHPAVKLDFRLSMSKSIKLDIRDNNLDAGFFFGENTYPEVASVSFEPLRMWIVGPASWKEKCLDADWKDLVGMPWVMTPNDFPCSIIIDNRLRELGFEPLKCPTADNETLLRALVRADVGLTLMREDEAFAARDAGEVFVWDKEHLIMKFFFGYNRTREKDRLMTALLDAVTLVWKPDRAEGGSGDGLHCL